MRWSFRIFSVFGVHVRVHVTFLFIVAYFAFVWGGLREPGGWVGALYGVLLVVLLFALVVVHELSHSRVAAGLRHQGALDHPPAHRRRLVDGGDPARPAQGAHHLDRRSPLQRGHRAC